MAFKIEYYDLQTILSKGFGYDNHTATVVADYLDEQFEVDLTAYIWNVLPYFVEVFNTKVEALEYIESNGFNMEDCVIYECSNYNGVYVEHP